MDRILQDTAGQIPPMQIKQDDPKCQEEGHIDFDQWHPKQIKQDETKCEKERKKDTTEFLITELSDLMQPEPISKRARHVSSTTSKTSEKSIVTHNPSCNIRVSRSVKDVKVRAERGKFDDGYVWRKYGEKYMKESPNPRSYYRCVENGCLATKTMQACDEDDSFVLVIYKGDHTHCRSGAKNIAEPTESDVQRALLQKNELLGDRFHMPCASNLVAFQWRRNGIQLLLRLENAGRGERIFVGAIVHALPSEVLEFFFFSAKDMAFCIGIGLPRAKVALHKDLSITVEETSVSEIELKDAWMSLLSDSSSHLVMKVETAAAGVPVEGNDHVTEKADNLSWLCGVGLDCGSQCVDETYDAAETSWPLLYDMALFILMTNRPQCNDTEGKSRAVEGSSSIQGNSQSSIVDALREKRNNTLNSGNFQGGGGDGDEDRFGCNYSAPNDDDLPIVLIVTVYPLPKYEILDTLVMPPGLDWASIAPSLVFKFRQNCGRKRIYIKTQTRLELASQMDVFDNPNLFGWYHTGIQISVGCEDREGHLESGRVALLKQNSCRILNPRTSHKYTVSQSKNFSKANTLTRGGEAGLNSSSAMLGGILLQGSSSGSKMQKEGTSIGENIEVTHESICGGFFFRDLSRTERPACATFFLSYPLSNLSIWHDKEFLQAQGLFSAIEPSIEGTWIPLNDLPASPYMLKILRSLKLHSRGHGQNDHVLHHKQEYILPFYVNHAMTHLKQQRSKRIELSGDGQSVPNVLMVGRVY